MAHQLSADELRPLTMRAPRPVLDCLLLRRPQTLPSSAVPVLASLIILASLVLTAGVMRAVGAFGSTPAGSSAVDFGVTFVAIAVLAAGLGRLVSVMVQTEAVVTLGGGVARERDVRRRLLLLVLVAQVPVGARDLAVGGWAATGHLASERLTSLLIHPLDPFALWSVMVFCLTLGATCPELPRAGRVGAAIGFVGFTYLLKIAIAGLGAVALLAR